MTAAADAEPQAPETVAEKQEPKVADLGPKVATARQKDPKKVAAGRAGAASRKAKQERLEEELRKATERQVGTDNTPPTAETPEAPAAPPASPPAGAPRSDGSTITLVIGLAAVLGLAYFAASRRAPVNPPAPPPATPPPAQQLKVVHDPFHMD